jgi:hypothetical protein
MSSSEEDSNDDSNITSALLTAADRLLEVAEHGTADSACLLSGDGERFRTIEERLLQLHIEESAKAVQNGPGYISNGMSSTSSAGGQHHLNPCSNLVSLLCRRDRCNRLLVTLLPNNEGYSVHVVTSNSSSTTNSSASCSNGSSEIELFRLPYEDDDFLTYIDNEELPTPILDLLEKAWPELFYSGCVIAEVRDHRRLPLPSNASNGASQMTDDVAGLTSHVLLRPTTQSLICDVTLLCERSGCATKEERAMVESQLCLATQGPLCLDPDPVVSILARKSCIRRRKFATPAMRRHAKMFSQSGLNRKRKLEETAAPPELRLHDFVQKLNRSQSRPNPQEMLQQHQTMMRVNLRAIVQSQQPSAVSTISPDQVQPDASSSPAQIVTDVTKHARTIQRRPDVTDMTPHVVEEYILETAERGANRIYHTKLTIFQRLANEEYLGELYVERDFNERDKKGSTCRFVLGTRPHALRYINQFTEIFTEEGRKPVKITHLVPNQKPRITFTPGMRERMNERAAAVAAANAARASLAGGTAATVASSTAVTSATPITATATATVLSNGSMMSTVSNVISAQKPLLSVSVAGPSILKQTLSAPSNAQQQQQQIPIHTVQQQPGLTAVVRTATVLQQQHHGLQLPQTPHPPQQLLQHEATSGLAANEDASGEQEMAISAIMQSLMKDSAQFEAENSKQLQQQAPSSIIGVSGPQLPTCPVPQASLAMCSTSSPVSNSPVKLPQSPNNSSLHAKRVTLKNLLSAQAAQSSSAGIGGSSEAVSPIKSPQVKVTMSQLAAQLSRPVTITSSLPSYTQALADQAQAKAVQASPRPRLIVTPQHASNSLVNKVVTDAPNLQALLSGGVSTPPNNGGDNVIPLELNNSVQVTTSSGGGSLLERLVSGQSIVSSSPVGNSSPSPVVSRSLSSSGAGSGEAGEQITLAALLSKPPVQNMSPLAGASPNSSQMGSPTKASPLIQQLQQPIPPPRAPLAALPQSPRQQPQASPRMSSPRPVASSPQQQQQQPATVVRSNSLQQQLMQPPKSQSLVSVPLPVQDINNLHNGTANGASATTGSVVSLQNLLQGGMAVQVSQHPATQTSNSIPVQLNIPGLSAPVTLSLNVQDQQQQPPSQQSQPQKLVPTSTVVTMAAANASSSGTVLISQGSNIIQLPQQPTGGGGVISPAGIATMRTSTGQTVQLHAANAGNLLKGAQVVQVRGQPGGQPLYVHMPVTSASGQSIQIVRSLDQPVTVRQQPFAMTQAPNQQQQAQAMAAAAAAGQQLILNSVKNSQPSLITLSQQQAGQGLQPQQMVLQAASNNSTTTVLQQAQSVAQPGPRQVAIQLQEQPPNLVAQARVVNNQVNQRMRQQRKQSLK